MFLFLMICGGMPSIVYLVGSLDTRVTGFNFSALLPLYMSVPEFLLYRVHKLINHAWFSNLQVIFEHHKSILVTKFLFPHKLRSSNIRYFFLKLTWYVP
jgi:hypothetical protein